ncbi:hypothetical protein BKA70DRAFT_1557682 [Coprinopsis sp. MPI-PUGE-AT-0042]|nr:hypothetical protein BKA70DRAFT_1557682 [Coprinopsis sp. MPI-PUGE-AT-0042]
MDPHFQSQNAGRFPSASTVTINHGTFNDIKGNSYTYYNNIHYNVFGGPPQRRIQRLCSPSTRAIPHDSIEPVSRSSSSHDDASTTEVCTPGLFPVVENTLGLLTHLVDVPAGAQTLFCRISPDLRDLSHLVAVSSKAYQACTTQTPIGRFIRSSIDSRLVLCNSRLVALHLEMLSLPHHSIPLVRSVCRALYQWWTANEPEEITSIRSQLNAETIAFREWLSCLKSFYRASRLLLVTKAKLSWKDLDELFNSGPTLFKEIHVDKVIIVEPLQGDQLNIPIRFITSFEDIHHVVQLACDGTAGAKYIADRQYQLDDAATNASVNQERFTEDYLEDGKTFEVAMKLVRRGITSLEDCPRCGSYHMGEQEKINGWIRCNFCKTQFNSHISEASESDRCVRCPSPEGIDIRAITISVLDGEAASPYAVGQDVPSQRQRESPAWLYMMFRRLIIEIQASKQPIYTPATRQTFLGRVQDWEKWRPDPAHQSPVSDEALAGRPLPNPVGASAGLFGPPSNDGQSISGRIDHHRNVQHTPTQGKGQRLPRRPVDISRVIMDWTGWQPDPAVRTQVPATHEAFRLDIPVRVEPGLFGSPR